ncbi:MAG: hypothetical protein H6Q52_2524 [Deltaproteobacteria bacterium]|nr:hypothetical protein [Deltaproteobacteria bacterium]
MYSTGYGKRSKKIIDKIEAASRLFTEFVALMNNRLAATPIIDNPPLPAAVTGKTILKEG